MVSRLSVVIDAFNTDKHTPMSAAWGARRGCCKAPSYLFTCALHNCFSHYRATQYNTISIYVAPWLRWFTGTGRRRNSIVDRGAFLRVTAGTAIARLSHRNSVCPSVRPSVTRVDQAKTVQARIIKCSPSAAPRNLVSGSVTLFKNSIGVTPIKGPKWEGGRKILRFWTNNWPYLGNGAR